MKSFKVKKYKKIEKITILLVLCISLISCGLRSNRPLPFNKSIWNIWDVTFDESRYNMAIWFFKESWFKEKTKENILDELGDHNKLNYIDFYYNEDEENTLVYDLRYSSEFMERWNIDYFPKPTAYLKIYFDENNRIIKAELLEGKRSMKVEEYKIKKYWEIM